MIKVIESTTEDTNQETVELYEHCKPYLLKGISLTEAVKKLGRNPGRQRWFKDLFKYAESKGYVRK